MKQKKKNTLLTDSQNWSSPIHATQTIHRSSEYIPQFRWKAMEDKWGRGWFQFDYKFLLPFPV